MSYTLTNEIETSHKQRLNRYAKDDMLVKIYNALPDAKREPFVRYRELWHKADKERIDLPFPLNIYIEPVSSCNLKCYFCVRSRESWRSQGGNLFSKSQLGFSRFKGIIDEGVQYGLPAIWVGASGEALLEKDLCKMMRYAHDNGIIDSCLITNGTLLTESIVDELLDVPVTRINVSIDAFSTGTYTQLRGGDYDKLLDTVHYLLRRREERQSVLPVVRLTFVDLPENRHEQDAFVTYWVQRVDTVDVQKYFDFNVDATQTAEDRSRHISCSFPWRSLMVMGNGDIVPCCSFYGMKELVFGNIEQHSLKEIWDSSAFEQFKEEMKKGLYRNPCMLCHDSVNEDS